MTLLSPKKVKENPFVLKLNSVYLGLGPPFSFCVHLIFLGVWSRFRASFFGFKTKSVDPTFIFTFLYYLLYGKSNKEAVYYKNPACILYDNDLSSKLNKSKLPSLVGRTFLSPLLINKYIDILYRYSFFGGWWAEC